MHDVVIVGGGIAGASVAFFLKKAGLSVAVIDETSFSLQASLAAGAFINPVMGKPSAFKSFADDAFRFSVDFYAKNFPELFNKSGCLIYPKNEKTKEEYEALGEFIPSKYTFLDTYPLGAFLVHDSGIINPKALIDSMLAGVDRYNYSVSELLFDGGVWGVSGVKGKNIVLAQGAKEPVINEKYLTTQITKLWGQKCKIKTAAILQHNISSKVHIAQVDGGLAIGATHIRSETAIPINRADSLTLVEDAKETIDIGDYEVFEEVGGMRSASIDHFPIAGFIYDSKSTIEMFPSLVHGARLSGKEPINYENLYIHTGHGSRAFILAPYTAKLLSENIISKTKIPKSIDPARLLFRFFRKKQGQS